VKNVKKFISRRWLRLKLRPRLKLRLRPILKLKLSGPRLWLKLKPKLAILAQKYYKK
jgi:hypothetical protein